MFYAIKASEQKMASNVLNIIVNSEAKEKSHNELMSTFIVVEAARIRSNLGWSAIQKTSLSYFIVNYSEPF